MWYCSEKMDVAYILRRLRELAHVAPIIRRAIARLGLAVVMKLVVESKTIYGQEWLIEYQCFQTVGGIFLKRLKRMPTAHQFFYKRPKLAAVAI